MAFLGNIQGVCAANDIVHTRVGDCDVDPSLVSTLLVTPLDFTVPTTTNEAMSAAFKAGIIAGKVVPINGIEGADATGGDVANYATPYGTNIPVGINAVSVPYVIMNGGACLEKELSKLNRKQRRIFWIDSNGMVWGTEVSEGVGRGFIGSVMMTRTMATNQTTPYVKTFNVGYSAAFEAEWNNRFALESAGSYDGLMGVKLVSGTAEGTARIVAACSGSDEGMNIASMLETTDAKALLVDATGANPTTADIDPDTGLISNIAPTAGYRIAPASVLDGLNVVGYDGINEYTTATGNPDA